MIGWVAVLGLGNALAAEPPPADEAPPSVEEVEATVAPPLDLPPPLDDDTPEVEAGPPAAEPVTAAEPATEPPKTRKVNTVFTDDFELRLWQTDVRLPGFEDRRVLDYVEQVNRFTANIRSGPWSFYGQLDQVALTANSYFFNDVRTPERELIAPGTWSLLVPGRYDPQSHGMEGWALVSRNLFINLEKIRLSYEKGNFSLQVGDTYAAFGRGAALNLNRNVDIDLDTSLQGVKATWRPGNWDVQALIAQANRQQVFQDNPNLGVPGDRRHMVAGVRVDRYGLGPVNLGAHGVVYNFTNETGLAAGFRNMGTTPDAVVAGASIEAIGLGPTDWFFEGNGYAFPTDVTFGGEARKPGYSLYLSGAAYAGRATVLVEGKRYFNAERINAPLAGELYEAGIAPTLEYERSITEDSAAATNSNDIYGGRVQVTYAAIPGELVPSLSMAVFRDLDVSSLHFNRVPETIFHPVAGVEYTKGGWSTLANVGYRVDRRDGRDAGADRQLHGDVLSRFPMGGKWFFDLSVGLEWYQWGNNPLQQHDYAEMESAVAVQYGRLVTLIWYTDYSTNPLINTTGNLLDQLYGAGEIQIQPLPSLTVKAFYGAYKSGIRCSGGQCRVLPGFEGARVSLTAAF